VVEAAYVRRVGRRTADDARGRRVPERACEPPTSVGVTPALAEDR
jgi:hypothetical protein